MRKLRLGLCTTLFLGLLVGCHKNPQAPGKISGKVTYKGAPVTAGTITFHSEGKGSYNSSLGDDGTYEVVDIPTGPMKVTVETESANPKKKAPDYGGKGGTGYAERMAAEKKMGAPVNANSGGQYTKIPEKYADETTSQLTVTITAGKQVKDFDLTD